MYTPTVTADGSMTFFNTQYEEHYHNRSGAYTETMDVYIHPSRLAQRIQSPTGLTILDPFFGLGYCTFTAWHALNQILATQKPSGPIQLIGIESDPEIMKTIPQIFESWDLGNLKSLSTLFEHNTYYQTQFDPDSLPTPVVDHEENGVRFTLYVGDSRQIVPKLAQGTFDLIYHDAFSPRKQPELWTTQLFEAYKTLMRPEGAVLTYCAAAPVRKALQIAGFSVYALPTLSGKNGTHATLNPAESLPALTTLETALLTARSALPYEDNADLSMTTEAIHAVRAERLAASTLPTSSSIHKVYGNFSRTRHTSPVSDAESL